MRRWNAVVVCLALLWGCGGAQYAQRGDRLLNAQRYDEAIAAYESAVKAEQGGANQSDYRGRLTAARLQAARAQIKRGDAAFARHDLKAAGRFYRSARSYTSTDQMVLRRLSTLLKRRVEVEEQLESVARALDAVESKKAASVTEADVKGWRALISDVRGLLKWSKDYPQAERLWKRAKATVAHALAAAAESKAAAGKHKEATAWANFVLRLEPGSATARELLAASTPKVTAQKVTSEAKKAAKQGASDKALEKYEQAVALNPSDAAAQKRLAAARDSFLKARLAEAKAARRNKKAALKALRRGANVKASDAKLQKRFDKQYARAHRKVVKRYYRQGKRLERAGLFGAAMVSYRVASFFGGGPRDLAKRIETCAKRLSSVRNFSVGLQVSSADKTVTRDQLETISSHLLEALARLGIDKVGVNVKAGPKAVRRGAGVLTVRVDSFVVSHINEPTPKRKKYLHHVEFHPNPKWAVAQAKQAAALAELNSAGDRLRPLETEVNTLEKKLAKFDRQFVELKAKIQAEDSVYYANRKKPCADGTTRCPQSYANKRWAKHLTWYRDRLRKTNARIASLSEDYQQAQTADAKAKQAYEEAEQAARDTPAKLRAEIWKTHSYNVSMHKVKSAGQLTVSMVAKRNIALGQTTATHAYEALDFSTPGVYVRDQTLEPPRKSALPKTDKLTRQLAHHLAEKVAKSVGPKIAAHGVRFMVRAKAEKRLHMTVDHLARALSTGDALPKSDRALAAQLLLEATGYDWSKREVLLDKLTL